MKTHKATAKRIKVKKTKKNGKTVVTLTKRQDGQDHFNSRESGKVTRNKRTDNTMSNAHKKTVLRALPHS